VLREVYARVIDAGVPVVRTDLATAELAKVSANVMLAARVSLVNLLAEVCEAADADVGDLTEVLGLDRRIGADFLSPGIGYGGGCLPKDTRAFMARAAELGVAESSALLREVDAINMRQRARTVDLAAGMLGGVVHGARVACSAPRSRPTPTTYATRPRSTSPTTLWGRGAEVRVYDPQAAENVRRTRPQLTTVASVEEAVTDADLVLVLTDWVGVSRPGPGGLADLVEHTAGPRRTAGAGPGKVAGRGLGRLHALGRGGGR
jgi:UDPglucose 6-dehydrogenase